MPFYLQKRQYTLYNKRKFRKNNIISNPLAIDCLNHMIFIFNTMRFLAAQGYIGIYFVESIATDQIITKIVSSNGSTIFLYLSFWNDRTNKISIFHVLRKYQAAALPF